MTDPGRVRGIRRIVAFLLVATFCGCGGPSEPDLGTCGPWPDQAASPYVLPYGVGSTFVVGQGNCSEGSHGPLSAVAYAYDLLMPIGTPVVAARDGEVILVEERYRDDDHVAGHENFVNVAHADGTIAAYVHLTGDGALVQVGDRVRRGQAIGLSGNTGDSSAPHLHFHVQACSGCGTSAVTFRNTRPHPMGLQQGQSYTAEPYE